MTYVLIHCYSDTSTHPGWGVTLGTKSIILVNYRDHLCTLLYIICVKKLYL
ncbi:hypothetical protein HanHA300_Chr06g0222241 [Helianthus annuus]|nr:hypothetical protein HanHA300_Chr06g0222241 [Helianthus annuus]KAJ0574431.1 hypothetical protein HanHA89_Chr06g0238081 [Helianthus annuus]KAJ0738767.1 hypothetical protein HanLR1_Chr06g0222031 [Helianthus annuus]KAJ0741645.1 hypothetical protein HanOQP8_Chr06g0230401 [Helianthus annuus]